MRDLQGIELCNDVYKKVCMFTILTCTFQRFILTVVANDSVQYLYGFLRNTTLWNLMIKVHRKTKRKTKVTTKTNCYVCRAVNHHAHDLFVPSLYIIEGSQPLENL